MRLAKENTLLPMKVIGNSQYQKALNASLILNYLLQNQTATRVELVNQLGLRASTITYICNRSISIDLIRETPSSAQKRGSGRPAVSLELNRGYGRVIGIDMQAHYLNAVLCDATGTVLRQVQQEYPPRADNFEKRLKEVLALLDVSTTEGVNGKGTPLGVGIATPGIVHPGTATIEESWPHKISSLSLSHYIKKNFDFPVVLENDANCGALHFLWGKTAGSAPSFLYLLPRFHNLQNVPSEYPAVGIGLGIVIEGKLYHGVKNRAGEFKSALLNRHDHSELSLSIEDTYRITENYDLKRKMICEILQNLSFAVSLLDPSRILIGGDLAGEGALFSDILSRELKPTSDYLRHSGVEVQVLTDVTYDAAKGAAAHMLNELFYIPQAGGSELSLQKWSYMLANAAQ